MSTSLVQIITHIARTWPPALVRQTASQLETGQSTNSIARGLISPAARESFSTLQEAWGENPHYTREALALALLTAVETLLTSQNNEPDLVWTGPSLGNGEWRRTDAALLEVIQSAKSSLWLVTYAVHGGQILKRALEAAANRGATIHFVCESNNIGKIRGDNLKQVRAILPTNAQIYEWPPEKRGRNESGAFGTLHAKIAVADDELALLSSANLTDCALDFNIECGVLLHGQSAFKIARQIEGLVENRIWQPC